VTTRSISTDVFVLEKKRFGTSLKGNTVLLFVCLSATLFM